MLGGLGQPLLSEEEGRGGGKKSVPRRIPMSERISKYIEASAARADQTNPNAAMALRCCSPVLNCVILALLAIAPLYIWVYTRVYKFLEKAPTNLLQMIFGVALCFFGGTFTASIAAVEAFRQMGFEQTVADVHEVMEQFNRVKMASSSDDLADDDRNGIADVDEIPPAELAKRKFKLAMVTVNPSAPTAPPLTAAALVRTSHTLVHSHDDCSAGEDRWKSPPSCSVRSDLSGLRTWQCLPRSSCNSLRLAALASTPPFEATASEPVHDRIGSSASESDRISSSLECCYPPCFSFAQTTAIALGIVEVVQYPIVRALAPLLAQACEPNLPLHALPM